MTLLLLLALQQNVLVRGEYDNSFARFEKEQKGHVAFIGGSITQMNGYRPIELGLRSREVDE